MEGERTGEGWGGEEKKRRKDIDHIYITQVPFGLHIGRRGAVVADAALARDEGREVEEGHILTLH